MAKKKWIAGAIKRPGALRAAAKRAGAMTAQGTISTSWLRAQAKKKGRRGKQARLALTMRGFKKGKGHNPSPSRYAWQRVNVLPGGRGR